MDLQAHDSNLQFLSTALEICKRNKTGGCQWRISSLRHNPVAFATNLNIETADVTDGVLSGTHS
jgi:hypothetical protein